MLVNAYHTFTRTVTLSRLAVYRTFGNFVRIEAQKMGQWRHIITSWIMERGGY